MIEEVGPGGSFLDQESTVAKLHEEDLQPRLFNETVAQAWLKKGMPSLIEKARDVLNSLPLCDGPAVPSDVQNELMRIEEHFASKL